MRASVSREISLGVVPLEMSAWNPLIAPHAMVINANGKMLPANTGPVPSMNLVNAGIWRVGRMKRMPRASTAIVPSLTKVLR